MSVFMKRDRFMQVPLPYARLLYIESTGIQHIDTGFKPNNNTRTIMDVELYSTTSTKGIFGSRNADSNNVASYIMIQSNATNLRSDFGTQTKQINVEVSANRWKIDKNKAVVTIDEYTIQNSEETFTTNYNMTLFAYNDPGGVDTRKISGKLYACQIYDNNVLVRDYIPVRMKKSGEVGLWDKVNKKFYGNAGTGTFIAGEGAA